MGRIIEKIKEGMGFIKINSPFILLFIGMIFIISNLGYASGSDDYIFIEMIENNNIIDIVVERYYEWSGRVSIELIMFLLIDKLWLTIILNAFMFSLLGYLVSSFMNGKKESSNVKLLKNLLICSLIFLIQINVITSSSIWIAGAFNYLWPTVGMLIVLQGYQKYYYEEKISLLHKVIFVIGSIVASYFEQTSAIIVTFGMILIGYKFIKNKKVNMFIIWTFVLMVANFLVLYLAPGNQVREQANIEYWYPTFVDMSIFEKLYKGLLHTLDHMINDNKLIILILLIFLIYKNFKKYNKVLKSINICAILYILPNVINLNFLFNNTSFYDVNLFLKTNIYGNLANAQNDIYLYISIVLSSLLCISILVLLFYNYNLNRKENIKLILIFLSAIASYMILSLSPTIYASGHRIFFVGDILIILLTWLIISDYIKGKNSEMKLDYVLYSLIIFLGTINYIGYFDINNILNNFY